jgi:hypothetical protein
VFARLFERIFDRWSRSAAFTPGELAVLRALLPEHHPDSANLYAQAAEAPYVERKLVGPDRYQARIPYVANGARCIVCDQNVASPTIEVVTGEGRKLRFSTEMLRGGFLIGLDGVSNDGQPWPRAWNVELRNCTIPAEVQRWLPAFMSESARGDIIGRLAKWACLSTGRPANAVADALRVAVPAGSEDIAQCEQRLGRQLGEQYRELLQITDGFGIQLDRPYDILGTRDLDYVVDSQWIGVTPLYEDGYVAAAVDDEKVSDNCFRLGPDGIRKPIGDLKEHVRRTLSGVGP